MVKSATGLTGNGLRDWLVQRLSAVILALYTLSVLGFVFYEGSIDFVAWTGYMQSTYMRIFGQIAILAFCVHAWIGLWTVATDYIKPTGLRLCFHATYVLSILFALLWGFRILWT